MHINDVVRSKGSTVVTARPDASVTELLSLLAEHNIGAVVVSDDGSTVRGIVSERDIVRALAARGDAVLHESVGELMTSDVHTAAPEESLEELANQMTQRRIRHVPVVVEDSMVAIVTIGDVVKFRLMQLQSERDQLVTYIQS